MMAEITTTIGDKNPPHPTSGWSRATAIEKRIVLDAPYY